ncbi:hypothetical protein THTE_0828 [Thermogutta terrifontis]|uniref:Uncharacterized protein n=1 Tax=Thermogutta terrifontis TaxID=1331910 RepID=A0A286RBU5_9BACT|nr:hypothetical protein THTE_0828 [Thermogutta terrifontis]
MPEADAAGIRAGGIRQRKVENLRSWPHFHSWLMSLIKFDQHTPSA